MTSEKLGQWYSPCCPHWSLYLAWFSYWGEGDCQCFVLPAHGGTLGPSLGPLLSSRHLQSLSQPSLSPNGTHLAQADCSSSSLLGPGPCLGFYMNCRL